jgi:hypothetical protein
MNFTAVIGKVNVVNPNRRVYTKQCFLKMIEDVKGSSIYGGFGMEQLDSLGKSTTKTHAIRNIKILENNDVVADFQTLETPEAALLESLIMSDIPLYFATAGTEYVELDNDGKNIVTHFTLHSINAIVGER